VQQQIEIFTRELGELTRDATDAVPLYTRPEHLKY
jgi:hypothetical protein